MSPSTRPAPDDSLRTPLRTTKYAAAFLFVSPDRILDLVHAGDLVAVDVSTSPNARRKSWRFTDEALQAFIETRSTQPKQAKPAKKQKRAKYQPVFYK